MQSLLSGGVSEKVGYLIRQRSELALNSAILYIYTYCWVLGKHRFDFAQFRHFLFKYLMQSQTSSENPELSELFGFNSALS